jgi:predicted SnoaL-like aldol condensation-catalyzing enzyme
MRKLLQGCAMGALAMLALAGTAGEARADEAEAGAKACTLNAREVVDRFIPLFYDKHDVKTAFETYVHKDYVQHNPMAKDGRDEAIAVLGSIFASLPDHRVEIKQVFGEGDRVLVHYIYFSDKKDRGTVVADIFRVENCLIVEHWDVIQPFPETSANPHPMF